MPRGEKAAFALAERRLLNGETSPEAVILILYIRLHAHYPLRHADKGGNVPLSYNEIARLCRVNKSTVLSVIEELVTGGWMHWQKGGGSGKSRFLPVLQEEHKPTTTTRVDRLKEAGQQPSDKEWLQLKAYYGNRCLACGARESDGAELTLKKIGQPSPSLVVHTNRSKEVTTCKLTLPKLKQLLCVATFRHTH